MGQTGRGAVGPQAGRLTPGADARVSSRGRARRAWPWPGSACAV